MLVGEGGGWVFRVPELTFFVEKKRSPGKPPNSAPLIGREVN